MKAKNSMIVFVFFLIFLISCTKDLSNNLSISTGINTQKSGEGFDFDNHRVIRFREVNDLHLSHEESANLIDLLVEYPNYNDVFISLLGCPLFVKLQGPGFTLIPDSLNPSIKNLDALTIDQVREISDSNFLSIIRYNKGENILDKPVFAIKTRESKYAIIEITEIVIEENNLRVTFKWKYQYDGSTKF